MKAAIRRKYRPPRTLSIEEIEQPIPKDNEVLIKVNATTVNRTDCAILTGKPFIMAFFLGLSKPKQIITGTDLAGRILAIGKAVVAFKIDDRAFGFGNDGIQSQAQFISYSVKKPLAHMPPNISYEDAIASLEGGALCFQFSKQVENSARTKSYGQCCHGGYWLGNDSVVDLLWLPCHCNLRFRK
jgi:NADPH:quinone reductase-like Zn-dependent oxidoreductase